MSLDLENMTEQDFNWPPPPPGQEETLFRRMLLEYGYWPVSELEGLPPSQY
jgi:hypothetical protein